MTCRERCCGTNGTQSAKRFEANCDVAPDRSHPCVSQIKAKALHAAKTTIHIIHASLARIAGAGSGPGPPVTRLIQRQQDGPQHGCGRTGGSCNAGKSGEMAGDDWTVVGSRGRPRKPRRPPGSVSRLFDKTVRASNAGGSTAGGTRGARRSAEAPADDEGSVHGGGAHDRQQSACAATPLPGWGTANGHGGALNGRAGRTKKRQAWVERSPAERVGVSAFLSVLWCASLLRWTLTFS